MPIWRRARTFPGTFFDGIWSELSSGFAGHTDMKPERNKRFALVVAASLAAAWPAFARSEGQSQPPKPDVRHAAIHAKKKPVAAASGTARAARVPAAKRKKKIRADKILLPVRIGDLLPEEGKQESVVRPKSAISKVMTDKRAVDLDMGGDLPWPVPDSPMFSPRNRDIGFHVGVNYHLDQKWDLTGLAGMGMVGNVDAYPMKPNVEQIGIRAKYRF